MPGLIIQKPKIMKWISSYLVLTMFLLLLGIAIAAGYCNDSGNLFSPVNLPTIALFIASSIVSFIIIRYIPARIITGYSFIPSGIRERVITPSLSGLIMGVSIYFLFSLLKTDLYQENSFRELADMVSGNLFSGLILNFVVINLLLLVWMKISGTKITGAVTFWLMAALISFAEPALRISGLLNSGLIGSLVQVLFIFQAYYILSLSSFIFYRFRGLDGMLCFRMAEAVTIAIMATLAT